MSFLKTIEHQHVKPLLRRMRPYSEAAYAGVRVSYKRHLDGGGSTFGQDFVPLLRKRGMPKAPRAFEWCAGPGFIGFSLLAHGLCDTLCLADVNPERSSNDVSWLGFFGTPANTVIFSLIVICHPRLDPSVLLEHALATARR